MENKEKKENIKEIKIKAKDEILDQLYMSPSDLKILIPEIGINKCRTYINEFRKEMKEKKLFVPQTKPKVALTSLVKKKFGIVRMERNTPNEKI